MKIAFDIDGVIADTTNSVKAKVIEHFDLDHHQLTPGEDYTNIYLHPVQEKQDSVNEYVRHLFQTDPEVYRHADEISGAWLASYVLRPVAYITRRPDAYGIADATRIWLRENHFWPAPVHFIPKGTCKSTKAQELGVDILIEDSPYEIVSCRENGLDVIVMRYKYNDSVITPDTKTAQNWSEIMRYFDEIQ